ncbi:MAG: HD domain-containing protein [Anaerolineae bacterium]|nr:HD domain-containing protein [Anaerolineae bacterium]
MIIKNEIQGRIMRRMFQELNIKYHHFSIERAIVLALGLLVLWLIALMTFMENGKNHAVNLAFVSVLMVLLIGLTRALLKNKYQGYMIGFAAVMIAVIGYFRLSSFFVHTEIIFTLAIIGVSARWGTRQGIFAAILAMTSNGLLYVFYEQMGVDFEIFAIGGFFLASAFIVGVLSKQREAALKAHAEMNGQLNQTYNETLRSLVKALDTRDSETGGHSERVTLIALSIAQQLNLDEKQIQQIHWGALLHDVGKIGIPDYILRKPGKLTDEEWEIMRSHPQTGYEMLKGIPFLAPALDVVLHHHERYDGAGYPSGLTGMAIPLSARIFAIADSFDAMTNDRPYRKAFTRDEAIAEINRCINKQFDPIVVDAFLFSEKQGWTENPHYKGE